MMIPQLFDLLAPFWTANNVHLFIYFTFCYLGSSKNLIFTEKISISLEVVGKTLLLIEFFYLFAVNFA